MPENCNTCGDTGRHETTFEEEPTVLVDIGPCRDCSLPERLVFKATGGRLRLWKYPLNKKWK